MKSMSTITTVLLALLAVAAMGVYAAPETGTFVKSPPTSLRVGVTNPPSAVQLQLSGAPSTDTLDLTCTPTGGVDVLDTVATGAGGAASPTAFSTIQPRLGINFIMKLDSAIYPTSSRRRRLLSLVDGEVHATDEEETPEGAAHEWRTFSMDPYTGEIEMFAGGYPPEGWALCQGQILQKSNYQALFALLGSKYGGDGTTTFALPDLRGRTPIHKPSDGARFGLKYGAETATLTQVPVHLHSTTGVEIDGVTTTDGSATQTANVRTPSLSISMEISHAGIFPVRSRRRLLQDNNIARITMFAGDFVIKNMLNCDGQTVSSGTYGGLASVISTTYGGDSSNFKVPDLRGRVPVGMGTGTGLPAATLATVTGGFTETATVTVTAANVPSHSHAAGTNGVGNIVATPAGTTFAPLPLKQPSLVLNYIICIDGGIFPQRSRRRLLSVDESGNGTHTESSSSRAGFHTMDDTDPFIGQIQIVAQNYAPNHWALCDGSTLSIQSYTALFAIIGTTYGGNGNTNFKLPDFRGRIPVGTGTGPGLTAVTLGQMDGAYSVSLTAAHLPSHTHRQLSTTPVASQSPARLSIDAANVFMFALRATSATETTGSCTAVLTTTSANYVLPGTTPGKFTFAITHKPVATAKSYTTDAGTPLSVSPSDGVIGSSPLTVDPDTGDTLTANLQTDVSSGVLTLSPSGAFTYTPNTGYSGTDQFTYRINDGTSNSNTATVTITVKPKPFIVDAPAFVAFTTDAKLIATPGAATVANTIMKVQCVSGFVQCNSEAFTPAALLTCDPSPHECSFALPVGKGASTIAYRAPDRSAAFPVNTDTCTYTLSGTGATGVTAPIASTIHIGTRSIFYTSLPSICTAAGTVTGAITPEWAPPVDVKLTATCYAGSVASVTLPANSIVPVPIVYTAPVDGSSGHDTCTFALSSDADSGLTAQRYFVPTAARVVVGTSLLRSFTFSSVGWLTSGVSSGGVREFKVTPSSVSTAVLMLILQCRRNGGALVDVSTITWPAGSTATKMGIYTAPVMCGTDACVWKVSSASASEVAKYALPTGWAAIKIGSPANARDTWRQAIKSKLEGY